MIHGNRGSSVGVTAGHADIQPITSPSHRLIHPVISVCLYIAIAAAASPANLPPLMG